MLSSRQVQKIYKAVVITFTIAGCLLPASVFAQTESAGNGYEISVSIKPLQNQTVFLGYYFGSEYPIVDTIVLNENSEGTFSGPAKLDGGMYMLFTPDQSVFIDMLVDKEQHFSINASIMDGEIASVDFNNSPENSLLNAYKSFMFEKQLQIEAFQQQLEYAENSTDSSDLIHKLSQIDKDVQEYRNTIIRDHPNTFFSTLLNVIWEPEAPPEFSKTGNSKDSVAAAQYIKRHYWDKVNFWDDRIARTPFFESKLDRYFFEILDNKSDSVIKYTDLILSYASASPAMTRFVLSKLVNGTMTHYYKWDDAVFIHLFEKYISGKKYDWLNDDEVNAITERAYYAMGNFVGTPAPDILLPDPANKKLSLYDLKGEFTLLCFWDPTCSHCLETLPRLDSIYNSTLKKSGVSIFSVAMETDGTKEDWLNFMRTGNIPDWSNVYNSIEETGERSASGKESYTQLYDVWFYPTFFLLNKEKKFIAKKLTYEKMLELLGTLINKKLQTPTTEPAIKN